MNNQIKNELKQLEIDLFEEDEITAKSPAVKDADTETIKNPMTGKLEIGGMGTMMLDFKTTKGAELWSVEHYHNAICSGKYAKQIADIRKAYAEGTIVEERDKNNNPVLDANGKHKMVPLADVLKKQTPYFVVQANVLDRRLFANAKDFTGFAPIDIDHLTPEALSKVMERMRDYKWVKEGSKSCRDEGAHFIVAMGRIAIDQTLPAKEQELAYNREYKRRYAEICEFIERELGVSVDGQCKDVLRGFFMSHDPNAFIRKDEEMEIFPYQTTRDTAVIDNAAAPTPASTNDNLPDTSKSGINTKTSEDVTPSSALILRPELIKAYLSYHQYKPSQRHSWWVGFAQYLKYKGVRKEEIASYLELAKNHLIMCDHLKADDPTRRSATEVKEAMEWGYDHSETKQEFILRTNNENGDETTICVFDDSEFRAMIPSLPSGLKESVKGVPAETIMPILSGIMPLAMCYASKVKVRYCDGKLMRLNCMTLVIGGQGGKKSSVKFKLDIWREPMREQDGAARKKFDAYKKLRKTRKANEKLPPEPTDVIIEVPITISCSTLLKRMKNAGGSHLFSFGEELDTLRKTNGAGSWSSKYDVYRLGFDNGEWGQDYNSDEAESGIVNVAYNWTILGTEGALAKCFSGDNVENGLAGRVLLSRMPSSEYEYMPAYQEEKQTDVEAILRAVDILKNAEGTYEMPRLRKHMTQWCNKKADEARENKDKVIDTFRKRASVIGFRCGVVFYLLEQREKESNGCLQFAELMAEYCLANQCDLFGSALLSNAASVAKGSGYQSRNKQLFDELPADFTWGQLVALRPKTSYNALRNMIYKWKKDDLIVDVEKNHWRKVKKE